MGASTTPTNGPLYIPEEVQNLVKFQSIRTRRCQTTENSKYWPLHCRVSSLRPLRLFPAPQLRASSSLWTPELPALGRKEEGRTEGMKKWRERERERERGNEREDDSPAAALLAA